MYMKVGNESHGGEFSLGEAAGDCKRFPAAISDARRGCPARLEKGPGRA
jgi:hypothetical protein